MRSIFLVLMVIGLLLIVVFVARFWARQSDQKDIATLTSLKQVADSGVSVTELLSKAAGADYVISKLHADSPRDVKIKLDNDLAWDQIASLNDPLVSEVSKIQTGEIELRKRSGGYFLSVMIVNGKIESSKQSPSIEK